MVGRSLLLSSCLLAGACDGPASSEPAAAPASAQPAASAGPVGAMSLPFSQAAVDQVVATHRPATLRACLAGAPADLPGELELVFEVSADGTVTDVAAMGGGAAARPVRECVEGRAAGWSFAPPGKATTATASLTL